MGKKRGRKSKKDKDKEIEVEINFETGVYSSPHDIAFGDLNGDGLLDVVTSEKGDVTDDFEAHTGIFINTSYHKNISFLQE